MKLGILCTMINGFGRRGYYNSQEAGLGRALAKAGHQVIIYKGISLEEKEDTVVLSENLTIRYLPMRHLGAHGFFSCRLLDRDLSGLLCFSDQQIFLPHVYAFCKRNGIRFVPYVGTAHSLHGNMKSRVMDLLFSMGTLRIYKKNPVLAKTEAAREELFSLGVRDVTVVPVGLDTAVLKKDFRSYDRAKLRKKHGLLPDDVVICNVSRLSPEKRPLELLDLFQSVRGKKPFQLLIVGDGALREAVEQKIKDLGLSHSVKLYPNVPYEDMWEIYTVSDYYLNMNRGEIFGMAIMEAVYYCTSVAASEALGPSVTLRGMKGHTMCADDKDLAAWITGPYPAMEDLEESAKKMEETFTWDRCADAFTEIVKRGRKNA